jgi:hypothetical protein
MNPCAFEIGSLSPGLSAEVQKNLRQNYLAFHKFVAVCIFVCGLVVLATFLG